MCLALWASVPGACLLVLTRLGNPEEAGGGISSWIGPRLSVKPQHGSGTFRRAESRLSEGALLPQGDP